MITADFIFILFFAIVIGTGAVCILAYGIYSAVTEYDIGFFIGMFFGFLCLSTLSGLVFYVAYDEYQDAKPQNQVKILRQKIFDAEKEYQKYLIDHPELKEVEDVRVYRYRHYSFSSDCKRD